MPVYKKKPTEETPSDDVVTFRVNARGAGRISTGKHDGSDGEEYYGEGETLQLPREVAEHYAGIEGEHPRMYGEIVSDKKPAAKA